MRKDITIEKIMLGGSKMNKTNLAKQYGCCWKTIDRSLNPDKYKKEKKVRIYKSILDPYKNIIDENLKIKQQIYEMFYEINKKLKKKKVSQVNIKDLDKE